MKQLVIAIAVLAFVQASQAQELIFLKDGTVVKGEVTKSTEKSVTAVVDGVTYTVSAEKFDPHFFYRVRDKALGNDAKGRITLAMYAIDNDLFFRAKAQFEQAKAIDPKLAEEFKEKQWPKLKEGVGQKLLAAANRAVRTDSYKRAKKYCSLILTKFEGTKAYAAADDLIDKIQQKIDEKQDARAAQRKKMATQKEETAEKLSASKRDSILDPIEKQRDDAERINHKGLEAKGVSDAKGKLESAGSKFASALKMIEKKRKDATDEQTIEALNQLEQECRSGGVQAYLNLANLYSARGSYQNGVKACNQALAIDPNSEEAKSLRAEISTAVGGWGFRGGRR
jgi:tetratricopeptide (TPR) repeat protein